MFNEDDLKNYKQMNELISKLGNWKADTKEVIQIYRSLVWFNQLEEKIKNNIMEVKKVTKINPEVKDAE